MHNHDIYTGKDLYDKTEFELIRWFGKRGRGLYLKARGIDHSEVKQRECVNLWVLNEHFQLM